MAGARQGAGAGLNRPAPYNPGQGYSPAVQPYKGDGSGFSISSNPGQGYSPAVQPYKGDGSGFPISNAFFNRPSFNRPAVQPPMMGGDTLPAPTLFDRGGFEPAPGGVPFNHPAVQQPMLFDRGGFEPASGGVPVPARGYQGAGAMNSGNVGGQLGQMVGLFNRPNVTGNPTAQPVVPPPVNFNLQSLQNLPPNMRANIQRLLAMRGGQ